MISDRARVALAAAKARGRGRAGTAADCAKARQAKSFAAKSRAADLAPVIEDIRTAGANTLRSIAKELNERGIFVPRGGAWSAAQVRAAIARIPALRRNVSPKRGQWPWQPCGRRISGASRQLAAVLHPQRRCLEVATGHIGWSAVVMTSRLIS
jgi:hypothetical protein